MVACSLLGRGPARRAGGGREAVTGAVEGILEGPRPLRALAPPLPPVRPSVIDRRGVSSTRSGADGTALGAPRGTRRAVRRAPRRRGAGRLVGGRNAGRAARAVGRRGGHPRAVRPPAPA